MCLIEYFLDIAGARAETGELIGFGVDELAMGREVKLGSDDC